MTRTTPQERQALGVTALLLLAGAGVRLFSAPDAPFRWDGVASDTVVAGELAVARAGAAAELERERIRRSPLAAGERIDPNGADALQLDRLPRVGAALADRIVEWRARNGPFHSLADLDSVPGVGPALLEQLAPHLTLPPAPPREAPGRPRGTAPMVAPRAERLDVNSATAGELEALPGIGPALAERIVRSRDEQGRFGTVEDLTRVPGIGEAVLQRIAPLVGISP